MVEGLQIAIAGLALGWTAAVVVFTLIGQKEYKRRRDAGKTWLIELNSNNKTAKVQLIKAKHEGHQVEKGPFVKFEGDYTYIDRENNRPLVVYNGDSGLPIRAKVGETEEMDGMILAAMMASNDLERIQRSHGGVNWVAIALIGGLVVVMLVGIIFWGVTQFMKTQGQGA